MRSGLYLSVLAMCLAMPCVQSSPVSDPPAPTSEAVDTPSYGVLLDAGSSSTKLKIYRWTKPATSPGIPTVTSVDLGGRQKKFSPGLDSVEGDLADVEAYLKNILQVAQEVVPAAQHAETPLFLLATAGFRLLGVSSAREGMQDVEQILLNSSVHPFRFSAGGASVLSGEEEAAYAWIAANYLLGFFTGNRPDSDSVGILEMGGGSTQIAFIPRDPLMAEEFQVIMGGRRYSLYVQSYLEFGLNSIRQRLEEALVNAQNCGPTGVYQPCMLRGDTKNIVVCPNITTLLKGSGNPEMCRSLLDSYIATAPASKCYLEPCAIGSVFQPSVEGIDFYAMSAFTYSLETVGAVRDDTTLDLDGLWTKAQDFCKKDISEFPEARRKYLSTNCMGSIYFNELFTKPYGFEKSTNRIKVTSKINGVAAEWALGAMLDFLSLSFTGDASHCSLTRR